MIIYLKYPRKRGFFSWDELSLVAQALGFHGDLFRRNFPAFIACQADGVAMELLLKLVCESTYLHAAVDATVNLHLFPWNIAAIHKTILILNERLLNFAEIHLVRVAYLFYEGFEAKGLPLDDNILQKTLKLCGRMISPQKMLHRLLHMIPRLQEPGFLQLHEFLEFVLWTDLYNPKILRKAEQLGLAKDGDGCFQMSDYEELLQTVDDRLLAALDVQHEVEECTYSEPRSSRDSLKRNVTESYINPTFRLIKVPKARSDFGILTKVLNQSSFRVKQSKCGYGNRPTTAPLLKKVTRRVPKTSSSKIQMVREHSQLQKINMVQQNPSKNQMVQMDSPKTARVQEESIGRLSKCRVRFARSAPDDITSRQADKTGFPAPVASAFSKYRMPSIATDKDLQRTTQLIDDLKFDMATLATRSEHLIDNIWLQRTKKPNNILNS